MPILFSKSFNGIELLKVNGDPNGISGSVGSLALDISSNLKYKCIGNSIWDLIIPWGPSAANPAGYYPSSFTPEKFGAKGNGTTDDYLAIQDAYDAAYAVGGILQFDAKVYKITQPIQTRRGYTTIRGVAGAKNSADVYNASGLRATTLTAFKGTRIWAANCAAFQRDDISDNHGYMTIENLSIVGDGQDIAAINFGVNITNATVYNRFINLTVVNFGVGFDISNQYGSSWDDCRANSCDVGFKNGYGVSGSLGVPGGANAAKITNVSTDACNICFLMIDGSGIDIKNVLAQQNCGPLLYLKPYTQGLAQISISGVHYETSNSDRTLCMFDGSYGSASPLRPVSAANITISNVTTNSATAKDGFKTLNAGAYSGLYRMTWKHISGVNYDVTLPDWAQASYFESCRLKSLNVSAPTSAVVLMCEFNGNYGNSIIKKDGINLLG